MDLCARSNTVVQYNREKSSCSSALLSGSAIAAALHAEYKITKHPRSCLFTAIDHVAHWAASASTGLRETVRHYDRTKTHAESVQGQ